MTPALPLPLKGEKERKQSAHLTRLYAVLEISFPSAACAAARRAIGTRNGEHDT